MQQFLIIIEQGKDNFSAYAPDLPGCVATGATHDETLENMHEAIHFHLEALTEDGEPVPSGSPSIAAYLAIHEPTFPDLALA